MRVNACGDGRGANAASTENQNAVFEEKLAEGFEELFTELVVQSSNGAWVVDRTGLKQHPEVSRVDAEKIASDMNKFEQMFSEGAVVSRPGLLLGKPAGASEYAKCVVTGVIPGSGLVSVDWGLVYSYIKQKTWGKLSKYLAKHATKIAAKELAKFTPLGLARSLIASAVGCAIWK